MSTESLIKVDTWQQFEDLVRTSTAHYPDNYKARIDFELYEINKQGLNGLWLEYWNEGAEFDSNPNNMLVPWAMRMIPNGDDPMLNRKSPLLTSTDYNIVADYVEKNGCLPHDFLKDADVPDIDIDCLPMSRDPIKEYAIERYGDGSELSQLQVCSVGTWQTYKFKAAIQDSLSALGLMHRGDVEKITSKFPEDVDNLKPKGLATCKGQITNERGELAECGTKHSRTQCPKCGSELTDAPTIWRLIEDHEELKALATEHPKAIAYAAQMVGRIRNMGMHAGALIIANSKLLGKIPMGKNKADGPWVTMWSEGNNQQLSKCGYIKWDILGLKTLEYIYNTCFNITRNRGIRFGIPQEIPGYGGCYELSGLDEVDPEAGYCGKFYDPQGNEHDISYNDKETYRLINDQRTDTIFQFDTSLAKSILSDAAVGSGVQDPHQLTLLNALGHPGPMQSIPAVLKNRDDPTEAWKEELKARSPIMYEILKDTFGVCTYQEQLTALWQRLGGFSATEAQMSRKDIAKKKVHKLPAIKEKWMLGASKTLGAEFAEEYWEKLETFGRYAFNKCLSFTTKLQCVETRSSKTVEEWYNSKNLPKLSAYDSQVFVDECVAIHDTGIQEVFRVEFEDDTFEDVTLGHKFLCSDGQYHEVREIVAKGLEIAEIESSKLSESET